MRIVVCAKEVLDPDAVNNYALEGRLVIGEDGKSLTQSSIPRLMNAYDEQAIEAALRIKEAGAECTITVVCAGSDVDELLKHAAALGADDVVRVDVDATAIDCHATAAILSGYILSRGGADLILCGRQASDDDQGVVPALVGEKLGMPVVTIARSVELVDGGGSVRVTRVTPNGDEVVEASCPTVVTISNELGTPRYPTMAGRMAARRKKATVVAVGDLAVSAEELQPRVTLTRQFVPTVQGDCEFLSGNSPADLADQLMARLRGDSVI